MFKGLLKVKERCSACNLDFSFNDAGDGPTVFIIMIVGMIILGGALYVELNYSPPGWVHFLLWPPMILMIGLPLLRMLKGILISLTWHHDASSGRLSSTENNGD